MRGDTDDLFEVLDPPPGGVAALRRGLRREPYRRRVRAAVIGLASAVLLGGLCVPFYRHVERSRRLPVADLAAGLPAAHDGEGSGEPAVVPPALRDQMALLRVPLDTDRVVFYYAAVLPPGGRPGPTASPGAGGEEPRDDGEAGQEETGARVP